MKKRYVWSMLLLIVSILGILAGCADQTEIIDKEESEEKISVVCTIFPEYDWVQQLLGENIKNFELTLLLDNGIDLHNYQPTAEDITKIANCDIFIYVGGESDDWVQDALSESENDSMQVLDLLDLMGDSVKEEEIKEGMEAEEEEEGEEEEGPEYDEHVWLSLRNSEIFSEAIADALGKVDPDNSDLYEKNCDEYVQELSELDQEYTDAVSQASAKTLLFGDRFPFRYLIDDYGLDYYAAFVGCSAETEASFETIVFLAGKVDELNLKHIMVIENSDQELAETIKETSTTKDADILILDSMQSKTSQDIEDGETYLSIMKSNLEVLKTALN